MMNDAQKRNLLVLGTALGVGLTARSVYRWMTRFDFNRRNVLITGGSRGLGLVLARELAREGAEISLCARDNEELRRARLDIADYGAEPLTIVADVTDRGQVTRMIERVNHERGPIDVVINNAGTIQAGPMEAMTLDDYDDAMRTHFYGPLYVNETVLPQMRRRGVGRIVNIASIGGIVSVPHLLPYCASKFALVGYSQGLRNELAKDGIVVTTVCPGLMRTGSPRNAFFKGHHITEYALFKITDSLPVATISAEHAAAKILSACRHGDAMVVLGMPAKLAATAGTLLPNLTSSVFGCINRFLPGTNGSGKQRARGADSESSLSQSWLTALTDRAARRNNEFQ